MGTINTKYRFDISITSEGVDQDDALYKAVQQMYEDVDKTLSENVTDIHELCSKCGKSLIDFDHWNCERTESDEELE